MSTIKNNTIVVSRTDSIGDVALTLPVMGILREKFPDSKLIFLGKSYTQDVLKCSTHIDEVWDWDEISKLDTKAQIDWFISKNINVFIHVFPRKELAKVIKKAGVPIRIGTSHRLYNLLTCNKRVDFTRKNSDLHEAQLNTKLLKPLNISDQYTLDELFDYASFDNIPILDSKFSKLLSPDKHNLVFHCKSKGSALEWGVDNFIKLALKLDPNRYNIFFTGTESESEFFRKLLPEQDNIIDLSGTMTLNDLIAFISKSDLLLAASTGPLHIAGLCNINCIGLFSPRRPVHPGRWRPLGNKVHVIEEKTVSDREGILDIAIDEVKNMINRILLDKLDQ